MIINSDCENNACPTRVNVKSFTPKISKQKRREVTATLNLIFWRPSGKWYGDWSQKCT